MQKTTFLKKEEVLDKKWYLIDASNIILGKLAVQAANILRGKNKTNFTPNVDCGDHLIVINAPKVLLSSNKAEKEFWYTHSGYIGGLRKRSGQEMIEKYSDELIYDAIKGMLPKNKLSNAMLTKLHVYKNDQFPQQAQKPIKVEITHKIKD